MTVFNHILGFYKTVSYEAWFFMENNVLLVSKVNSREKPPKSLRLADILTIVGFTALLDGSVSMLLELHDT